MSSPSSSVCQTLLAVDLEVPKPSLSASVQIALLPGAPGASEDEAASANPVSASTSRLAIRTAATITDSLSIPAFAMPIPLCHRTENRSLPLYA